MIETQAAKGDGGLARLAQLLRDAVLRAERLNLAETARILRQAQEGAERVAKVDRAETMN